MYVSTDIAQQMANQMIDEQGAEIPKEVATLNNKKECHKPLG